MTYTFGQHFVLAQAWCHWNGQRGTATQIARVMRRLDAASLHRMLTSRRAVPAGFPSSTSHERVVS